MTTCEGTANKSHCLFPFIYNGVEYDDCTVVNSFDSWRPWCVTKQGSSGEDDKWGYCDCEENSTVSLNASCEVFSGIPVCEAYLHGTVVFTDYQYNQAYLGTLMNRFNRSFYNSQQNSRCVGPSLQALCHLLFPECQKNTSFGFSAYPLPLCYSSCTALSNGSCGSEFNQMMKTVTTYFQSLSLNLLHFYSGQSICNRLPHKDSFSEKCADIDIKVLPQKAGPESSGSDNVVAIAVAVPIVCIGLILMCILVGLIWKKKKIEKTTPQEQTAVYIDMTGTEICQTKIEWDDDIAYSIVESLIDGKRLIVSEQIGEGQTQYS